MKFKYIFFLALGVFSLHATANDAIARYQQTEKQIALLIENNELHVGDAVFYKGNEYLLEEFDFGSEENSSITYFKLKKPWRFFSITLGETYIEVVVIRGKKENAVRVNQYFEQNFKGRFAYLVGLACIINKICC